MHLLFCNSRFTLTTPSNFLPGLSILSELLPLPLPLYCSQPLAEEEELKLISLRRLWSAFLHGVSSQLQEVLAASICTEFLESKIATNSCDMLCAGNWYPL